MTKRKRSSRVQAKRETNWLLIGGLIGAGILIFGVLLVLALRGPGQDAATLSLADYCGENPDRCTAQGSSEAPVTMVEVSDFGCSHCTDFHNQTAEPLTEQYVDTDQLRWIALPYALGTATVPAAASAMCAAEQERYFEYADAMFAEPDLELRLSPIGFRQAAENVGLDLDSFDNCVESGRYTNTVNQNREAARDAEVTGTPTFFINGEVINGAVPLSVFQQTIDSLINS
jgi:protein-disulfide isomerase